MTLGLVEQDAAWGCVVAPGFMGNIGQVAGVHNITNYMILDSKSCVCSTVAARVVGVFNSIKRSSDEGLGQATVAAKFSGMQILGANCRHTRPMVGSSSSGRGWGHLWAHK